MACIQHRRVARGEGGGSGPIRYRIQRSGSETSSLGQPEAYSQPTYLYLRADVEFTVIWRLRECERRPHGDG